MRRPKRSASHQGHLHFNFGKHINIDVAIGGKRLNGLMILLKVRSETWYYTAYWRSALTGSNLVPEESSASAFLKLIINTSERYMCIQTKRL